MRQTALLLLGALALAASGCADPSRPAEASEARSSAGQPDAGDRKPEPEPEPEAGDRKPEPEAGDRRPDAGDRKAEPEPAPPPAGGDHIYAKARHVWIQPQPRSSKGWLGYLTLGGSVRLWQGSAEKARTPGAGCDAWYRVEPDGYVCAGEDATLDPQDPAFLALRRDAGDPTSPYPFRYAESTQARRYDELPSAEKQRSREWDLDLHRERIAAARAARSPAELPKELVGVDLSPAGSAAPELFAFGPKVREARDSVAIGSTVAYTRAFDHGERTWLLTSDQALVPRDRVKPYEEVTFEGVRLGGDTELPIAFFRKKDRPSYARAGDGSFAPAEKTFARKSWVGLTGRREEAGGVEYAETREAGLWVRVDEAAIAEAATKPPLSDLLERGGRATWIDVSILGGTMVAYEGMKPVYATLISPGRGGLPVPGRPLISTASTPVGTFRVDGKFLWATMVSSTDSSVVHSDVMYVQNFHGAHALHGAYWHDAWGELKSGGCVNLSPRDSQWLFHWSEPRLPPGWHGMRSVAAFGKPTIVRVRR
jgi:hypothetical protein